MVERRKSRRFRAKIGIVSTDEEGLNFSFITDLSREGAFIETHKLVPRGTEFRFVLSNRRASSPIVTRVVRVKDAFVEGGPTGLGVRFERLGHMGKVLRDDLLLYLMGLEYHAMWEAA